MDLAQQRCLDVLGMKERLADPKSVTDEQLAFVVHLTGEFQTRLGIANCRKVTSEGCQVLGGCEPLRHLDLSGTAVADLQFAYMLEQLQTLALARCRELTLLSGLLGCRRLVRVNVRYTNIEDVVPLAASQGTLRWLDAGSTRVNAVTALAECHALETLRVDSCPFLRSLEPIKYVRALRELHCGYSGVRPDVLVAWLRAREKDADAKGVTAEPLCRNADLESVQHDAHLLRARAEHWFSAALDGHLVATMAEMLETDAQDVDERAPPQFAPRAMDVFASKCHHRTRFLLCDHDVPELRPTALHFAVLLGHEELIKALVQLGADPMRKAAFGSPTPGADGAYPGYGAGASRVQPKHNFEEMACTSFEMAQLCVSEHAWFAIDRMAERRVLDWKDKCAEKGRRVGFHLKNEEYHEKVEKFADEDADDPTVSRPTTPAAPAE